MKRTLRILAGLCAILFLLGCKERSRIDEYTASDYQGADNKKNDLVIVGQIETPAPTAEALIVLTPAPMTLAPATPAPETPVPTHAETEKAPTEAPTAVPTDAPTAEPEWTPTEAPTEVPTEVPTPEPTEEPTPAPTPTPVPTPDRTKAEQLCDLALSFLDVTYHRGGKKPDTGFDPGGFVYYCLNQVGVKVKHKTSKGYSEYEKWTRIDSMDDLEPGDLCFFITPGNESVNCVCIYLGNNLMIYPSSGEGKVITNKINSRYWIDAFVFARRVF